VPIVSQQLLNFNVYEKNISCNGYNLFCNHTFINKWPNSKWKTIEFFCDKMKIDNENNIIFGKEALASTKIDNAGGKSVFSEALSIEYFIRKYNACNIIFEKQISYWIQYKMCDFICEINKERIGVSVTRAMGFPTHKQFTYDDAMRLIKKKTEGLIVARAGVSDCHSFYKSVLHIWCQSKRIAKILIKAYKNYLDLHDNIESFDGLRVLITVCDNKSIYDDRYKFF
jgi:hypothetical protein